MHHDFWHDRWQSSQIGFHQSEVNTRLVRYWPSFGFEPNDPILVPLCGKSLDMWWLRNRGHPVLGIELSPLAVRDFFREAGLTPTVTQEGPFEVSEAGGVRIFRGDFFDLTAEHLQNVRGVYDRAAIIALPPNVRLAYTRALKDKLPRAMKMLLLTLEASPPSTGGPPFSVEEKEVRELYEPAFDVQVIERSPFEEASPHLQERGHETVANVVYSLIRGD